MKTDAQAARQFAANPAAEATAQSAIQQAASQSTSPFDYLIVGSGAGGGPLACRLALAGKKVLLVEAGKDPKEELVAAAEREKADAITAHRKPRYDDPQDAGVVHDAPLFHGAATEHEELSWQFSVRHYEEDERQREDHKYDPTRDPSDPRLDPALPGSPQKGSDGKGGIFYPRSSGLGGCTAHHAMIVIRPNDRDWEQIADLTNDDSWRAKNMQPYFAKFEQCLYIDEYRGFLAALFGWCFKGYLALMRFLNPKSVLDEGGHGRDGWQPTSLISPALIKLIVESDNQFTTVLIKSAFKVIKGNSTLTAVLKRFLITLGFVRSFDPNDTGTRKDSPAGGVYLIPVGTGGDAARDENGVSLKGRRAGVREFILKTQEDVNNRKDFAGCLHIAKGVHVTRLVFDDSVKPPRAIGMAGVRGDHLYQASPRHGTATRGESVEYFACPQFGEIILSGGTFNTPQLLMLSGIGDAERLQEINAKEAGNKDGKNPIIKLRAHLPGVGRNLQDRYEVGVVSELREDLKSLATLGFDPNDPRDRLLAKWRATKEGLYTSNGGALAILQRTDAADGPEPDLFTFGAPAAFRGYYWNWSKELLRPAKGAVNDQRNLWTWVILKAYTRNNGGTVRLRSADPFDTPAICFHSFDEGGTENWEKDVDALAEAVTSMREINAVAGSPFVREVQPAEYLEKANADRRANGKIEWTLRDWIKNEAWGHHACGTCRMGSDQWQEDTANLTDKNAVLDSKFKVHGVKGLRVVDASVFPKIPGYFILAPIFMVSEKAAETILKESCDENYPVEISDLEMEAIRLRRKKAWVNGANQFIPASQRPVPVVTPSSAGESASPADPPLQNIIGLALSGGGVRSATFSLGVLQALAERGRLRHIDYLSTVSGGAFTGSFLGRLFARDTVTSVSDPAGRVEELLKENQSAPLRWLRTQANYLFASGADDWLMALGIYFRNVFSVHLVIGALLLALFGALAGVSHAHLFQRFVPHVPGSVKWFGFEPSAWWWLPLAMLGLVIVPMKLAFWLAPKKGSYRAHPPYVLAAWLILIASAAVALTLPGRAAFAVVALGLLGLAWVWQEAARHGLSEKKEEVRQRRLEGVIVRNRLSRGLGEALILFLVLVGWVVLDSIARSIADPRHLPEIIAGLMALSPTLQLLRSWAMKVAPEGDGPSLFTKMKLVAVLLALLLLLLVNVLAHSLFAAGDWRWAWGSVVIALLVSIVLGRAFDFLNLTSLHASYSARLVRTFLGASNEARTRGADNIASDVSISHPDDDLPHHKYRPEEYGGPLHLISVCVNETVDHASQREIRERQGLLMTIGSFGVSVGRRYFARWSRNTAAPRWLCWNRKLEGLDGTDSDGAGSAPPSLEAIRPNADRNSFHPLAHQDDKPAVVQSLSLGDWVATSGAAFSTGRGRASNPLEALFMGLCNVRLGCWWNSGVRATERPGRFPANLWRRLKELPSGVFRMQDLLLSEWRARFHGPSHQLWNLTDGGHLDNSAAYELIRRRVPFIICTDATRDLDYSFEDFANLVRNVRVDFGAEVEWQSNPAAALPGPVRKWINLANVGTLQDLRGNKEHGGPGTRHAALARINHANGEKTWLLLIKASLIGNESLDVAQYAKAHKDFPQDSTADQIYDDEQWESYRQLGYQTALSVLSEQTETTPFES